MMRIWISIFVFMFGTVVFAEDGNESVVITEHRDMDGDLYSYAVSLTSVRETPQWNGLSNSMPLSVSEAVDRAFRWIKKKEQGNITLQTQQVAIRRIFADGVDNRWYYAVSVDAKKPAERGFSKSFLVILLMDGTVVNPVILRPQPSENTNEVLSGKSAEGVVSHSTIE